MQRKLCRPDSRGAGNESLVLLSSRPPISSDALMATTSPASGGRALHPPSPRRRRHLRGGGEERVAGPQFASDDGGRPAGLANPRAGGASPSTTMPGLGEDSRD